MQTLIKIPLSIKRYLEDEKNVPLIENKGTLWYNISKKEKELFSDFVKEIDNIPENIWRKYPEKEILKISFMGNLADRIVRNCIIKEN